MSNDSKKSSRPVVFPKDYGTPEKADDLLTWDEIEEALRSARNYWLASSGPDGTPHVRPVDGVWVLGVLCFGGSPETRWVRNLQANSKVSVNLPSDELAVILEGNVELVTDPMDPIEIAGSAASREKYPQYFKDNEAPEFHPFWVLRPSIAYAWTLAGFPNRATRWSFERQ